MRTDEVQNLESVLRVNQPLLPDTVMLGPTVQNYSRVLQHSEVRRSARIRAAYEEQGRDLHNYKELNKHGWTDRT